MRIEPRAASRCPWYLQPIFWAQRKRYGAVLDSGLVWSRSPRIFAMLALLYGAVDRRASPIAPALRSLLTVRISQLNGCHYCVDLNSATLLERGIALEKLDALAIWQESHLFDGPERASLGFAEAMTLSDREVVDAHMVELRRYFDDDAIVELTALIAFQNMSSKFNSALGIDPQGFCRLPSEPNAVEPNNEQEIGSLTIGADHAE